MAGRLGEGSHHELRIHGVAGTPPEGMLDDLAPTSPPAGACGNPPKGVALTVWRRRASTPGLRAYSWSSVTSGSARSALYLLLVPHLLVNMAGWAALPSAPAGSAGLGDDRPPRGWPVRLVTAGMRLLAVTLTVIMAQWALLVVMDLVAYQWAIRIHGLPPMVLGVGVVAAGLVMELVLVVTRLRLRPVVAATEEVVPLTDPVGHAWLTRDQQVLWSSPHTIALQRSAHHGVAHGSVALVAVGMARGWGDLPAVLAFPAVAAGALAVVLGVGSLLRHSLSSGTPGQAGSVRVADLAREVGRLGVLLAAITAGAVQTAATTYSSVTPRMAEGLDSADLTSMAMTGQPVILPVIRDVGLGLTMGYTAACLLVALLAWAVRLRPAPRPGHALQAWNLPGLALLGGAVGGGMGAAIAAATSRVLSSYQAVVVPGPLPEVLAIAFATLAILLGWVVVVGLATQVGAAQRDRAGESAGSRVVLTTAVQRLLRRGSWLTATLTVLAVLGVGMITALVRAPDNPLHVLEGADPLPQVIVLFAVALAATAVGLGVIVWTGRRAWGVATGLVLLVAATTAVVLVPGEELVHQLRPAAMAIGLLTPAGFVLGRGISALRSRSDRRTVAILWDVGTFLPRWFDPLSPPTYGDLVVTDLQDLVTEQLAGAGPNPDGADRTLLLAPHSQGTVIAATAVLGLPPDVGARRLALLTYGSPLQHLYAEFFPRLFDHATFTALARRLDGRWRNLARTSDPIAAPVGIEGVDIVLPTDPCGRGHSAYPREASYGEAVTALQRDMGAVLRIPDPDGARRS